MAAATPLAYALLGLLHQAPRSGYDLRKLFASTPLRHMSDSPGAIYPALRRLERQGFIAPGGEEGARRRRCFIPTRAGRRAFAAWLALPVTRDDLIDRLDAVMLRFAFSGEVLGLAAAGSILAGILEHAGAEVGSLEAFLESHGPRMPLTGRMAVEQGVEAYRALARWAGKALGRLAHGRRPGKEDKR